MIIQRKKAQSVLEYVILLTVIVGAFLALKATLSGKLETNYKNVTDKATDTIAKITFFNNAN